MHCTKCLSMDLRIIFRRESEIRFIAKWFGIKFTLNLSFNHCASSVGKNKQQLLLGEITKLVHNRANESCTLRSVNVNWCKHWKQKIFWIDRSTTFNNHCCIVVLNHYWGTLAACSKITPFRTGMKTLHELSYNNNQSKYTDKKCLKTKSAVLFLSLWPVCIKDARIH